MTSTAAVNFPSGALTCTPCTIPRASSSISRAIMHAFGPRMLAVGAGGGHPLQNLIRYRDPQFVAHELGIAHAGERPDAGKDRDAGSARRGGETLQQPHVEDRLSDREAVRRPRTSLEAPNLLVDVGDARIGADSDDERGSRADGVGADVHTLIEIVNDIHQSDSVHVEHGGRVRIVAELGRVARDADEVVQPEAEAPSRSLWMPRTLRSRQV